jgi:amino-acid N-acetyltransferase
LQAGWRDPSWQAKLIAPDFDMGAAQGYNFRAITGTERRSLVMVDNGIFPVTFSGLRPGEAPAVRTLIEAAGLGAADLEPADWVHFIVARKGDAIVGAVGLEPFGKWALLRSLVVAAAHRQRAIASRLVAAIEKYARARGVGQIYLLTTSAVDFFVKQGYQMVERAAAPAPVQATEEFRTICPATAACLHKRI